MSHMDTALAAIQANMPLIKVFLQSESDSPQNVIILFNGLPGVFTNENEDDSVESFKNSNNDKSHVRG